MPASIDCHERRPAEEEVVAVWIAGIDAEMPIATVPIERAVEVAGGTVGPVLPVEKDVAQVKVTLSPVVTVEVIIVINAHQVVKVHFIGGFILVVCQVEFISHLVGEEESLLPSLFITHRIN